MNKFQTYIKGFAEQTDEAVIEQDVRALIEEMITVFTPCYDKYLPEYQAKLFELIIEKINEED